MCDALFIGIRCHNGLCDNVLFTISGWGNDPNLRVNTESKNQENYGRLWFLRFVTEDDDDESMVVNYNSQTFWSVERQGSALKLVLSSTSCSNQPKFRFANVFSDTYHVMYKDTASKELYLLSPIINKPAKKLDPNYVRKNFTDESYFFIFNSTTAFNYAVIDYARTTHPKPDYLS
uniref:Uncharacterized protein n=1 Tax=Romanomermis culicivorax TaxID=13658 RepID=A0A915HYD4_ROMCU